MNGLLQKIHNWFKYSPPYKPREEWRYSIEPNGTTQTFTIHKRLYDSDDKLVPAWQSEPAILSDNGLRRAFIPERLIWKGVFGHGYDTIMRFDWIDDARKELENFLAEEKAFEERLEKAQKDAKQWEKDHPIEWYNG
ncbi:hypothetical protein phiOC_p237 [Ochrobactrum phage vB_OspM_OC]|nr:hypothetical protein phiOC_p237 [Ochrobactrum phage vB_OspM_OC]